MIALIAVFALLVQALIPALANAAPAAGGQQVICTGHGLQTIAIGHAAPAKGTPAHACEHCVCPPLAAAPPILGFAVATVSFARDARPAAISTRRPAPARAPPRPPGQGPPTSDA
jgi:hypothetical protein